MIIEHRGMWLWRVSLVVGLVSAACTKSNPKSCMDGTCTDPALPFCDLDGALAGEPETCIAVACNANEFVACREDRAITCNATGTDYELELCQLGCDDASGCRLCEPNETACTNGVVASCDANGRVVASMPCELGCFENEPRCRDIAPSNNLGIYLDMVADPPDLDLTVASIDTGTGTISSASGPVTVPNFLISNGAAPSVRVFIANTVNIQDALVSSTIDGDGVSGPAFAIVARGNIVIRGRVSVDGKAGGLKTATCLGGDGYYTEPGVQTAITAGSGGGGNATAGAAGGNIGVQPGGPGGGMFGGPELVPLQGGCASGGVVAEGILRPYGSPGGGAIQLTSRVRIEIQGIVDVRGSHGREERVGGEGSAIYGGGAGGGILLEAPTVVLGLAAALIAKGGGGGGYGVTPNGDDTAAPAIGTPCSFSNCGSGGNGASVGSGATPGASVASPSQIAGSGGGGGGIGRVRINTRDGTYSKTNTTVEAATVTAGPVSTR